MTSTSQGSRGASMHVIKHDHLVAAQWQLLQALQLYEVGDDYYSVITLAGAAEEVLGKLLKSLDHECALDTRKATIPLLSKKLVGKVLKPREVADSVNKAKNWLKHGEGPEYFDARFEAEDMLDRAIQNFWPLIPRATSDSWDELTSPLLDAISRYDETKRP